MDKMIEISRKYAEPTLRMAITHLIDKGREAFVNLDIEETCKKVLAETPKNSLITAELQAEIIRCCKELCEVDIWDILRYVKTEIEIYGVYTVNGQLLRFLKNATGDYVAAYIVPNGADDEQISEASERLDVLIDEYGKAHNGFYGNIDYRELIKKAFAEQGITLKSLTYHKNIYM